MTYYCLNCSTAIQGQRRKYCSDKCSDEYHLKKSREAHQSVIPKGSYRKSEVCSILKCSTQILAAVIETFKISLNKTSTGKSEYVTQENFNLIKQRLKEYNSLPKIKKITKKRGKISATQIANEIGISPHLVNKIIKKYNIKGTSLNKRSVYYDESVVELVKEKIKEHYNEKENYLDKMQIAVLFGYNPKDLEAASKCLQRIKQKWGVPPCEPRYIKSGVDKFSSRICYPKEPILKWIEQIKSTDEWKRKPSGRPTLSEEEKQRRLEQKLKEEKEFREQTKNLIGKKEAIALLGYKSYHTLSNNLDKLPSTKKVKNKYYYKPSEIIELKKYLEQIKQQQKIKENSGSQS